MFLSLTMEITNCRYASVSLSGRELIPLRARAREPFLRPTPAFFFFYSRLFEAPVDAPSVLLSQPPKATGMATVSSGPLRRCAGRC